MGTHAPGRPSQSPSGGGEGFRPPPKGGFPQKTGFPAIWGNDFVHHGFIAPDEPVADLGHSPEEIDVASPGAEFRRENRVQAGHDGPAKKHVTRAAFGPRHGMSGFVFRSHE